MVVDELELIDARNEVDRRVRLEPAKDFRDALFRCEIALANAGVFHRAGRLVYINQRPSKVKAAWEFLGPRIELIHPSALIGHLTRGGNFLGYSKGNEKAQQKLPPSNVLNCLYHQKQYSVLPELTGLQCQPLLLADGTIYAEPGYHEPSGRYLILRDRFPDLLSTERSLELLTELLVDFPLSPTDQAAVIAYILTVATRHTIEGQVPAFCFDGNRAGVGKGLLGRIGVLIGEGTAAPSYPGFPSNDELRKVLTAVALQGASYIAFDNVSGPFGGPVLECVLTAGAITDRILGSSDSVQLPFSPIVIATANGYEPTSDMVRRSIVVTLDSDDPTPHLRSDFTIPDLEGHVKENRPLLLMAAISIVANHLKAGCPSHGLKPLGSFSQWDRVIRAAVIGAGLADPCSTLIESSVDVSNAPSELEALFTDWSEFDSPTSVADGIKAAQANGSKYPCLTELVSNGANAHSIGVLFRSARGREINGMKLVVEGGGSRGKKYQVVGGNQ